jgi:hypothetical protein
LGAFEESRRRRQSVTRPSAPTLLLDLPHQRSPENPQKYFQKVTFFTARKTTTQMTTKNHQLTTFSPQKTIKKTHKKRAPL